MSEVFREGSPLDKSRGREALTSFDRQVQESLRKVLWLPDEFKDYMVQYQALNQLPIPISQVMGAKVEILSTSEFAAVSPFDGQQVLLEVSSGKYWMLRYNEASTSSHKWEFISGSALNSENTASFATSSTSYVDDGAGSPTVTVPRAGDYRISYGVRFLNVNHWATVKVGAASADDADAINLIAGVAISGISPAREVVKTGLSASDVVKVQYRSDDGASHAVSHRWLNVVPERLS